MGRERREEVVDRRTVSTNTSPQQTKTKDSHKHGYGQLQHTQNVRGGKHKENKNKKHDMQRKKTGREKGREKIDVSKCSFMCRSVRSV